MRTVVEVEALRAAMRGLRAAGRVAFVPTMGNLHEGHLALVRAARRHADAVVVSIFVNPLQFGRDEDLERYPRTPEADARALESEGVELLFMPTVETMYPVPLASHVRIEVPGLAERHCGASRPGHFSGVATVVCKLFNLVQPDLAVFGRKDYQQLLVIRRMVRDLAMPVEILGVDTVREPDGLAMSSRNRYLTPEERAVAPCLHRTLREAAARIAAGERDWPRVEREASDRLSACGMTPEYVAVADAETLEPPGADSRRLVILAAARLGRARLIDNLEMDLKA